MITGRPVKAFADRYPSGRVKRPTVDQLKSSSRKKMIEETAAVLAQPHRRGDPDRRLENALGRFCKRMGVREEIRAASEEYIKIRIWWGVAVQRPKGFENVTSRGSGEGPSEETIKGWLNTYVGIDTLLDHTNPNMLYWFRQLVVDNIDAMPDAKRDALLMEALRLVAVHMGRISGKMSAFD